MRGFGPIHRRTKSGIGFCGEEFYADFDNLLKFPKSFRIRPFKGESETIPLYPIFRRFYFDGIFSGKFEVGFRLEEELVKHYADTYQSQLYDVEGIVGQLLSRRVKIILPDARRVDTTLEGAGQLLRDAYLLSTTKSSSPYAYSVLADGDVYTCVAKSFTFVRSTSLTPIEHSNQRRSLIDEPMPKTELSRSSRSKQNFDLVIQSSQHGLEDESPSERAIRITYNQIRMLITAHTFYLRQYTNGALPRNAELKSAVEAFLNRASAGREDAPENSVAAIATALLTGESLDLDRMVDEIDTTLRKSLFGRLIEGLPAFLNEKSDIAIEASTTAATNFALRGGL